jgi:hypothetical protein
MIVTPDASPVLSGDFSWPIQSLPASDHGSDALKCLEKSTS